MKRKETRISAARSQGASEKNDWRPRSGSMRIQNKRRGLSSRSWMTSDQRWRNDYGRSHSLTKMIERSIHEQMETQQSRN